MSDLPLTPNNIHESDVSRGDMLQSPPQLPEGWNYETTIAKIEAIITRIELGELKLDDVFEQFELAVGQLQQCESFLSHHRQRMDLLIETLTDDIEGF